MQEVKNIFEKGIDKDACDRYNQSINQSINQID